MVTRVEVYAFFGRDGRGGEGLHFLKELSLGFLLLLVMIYYYYYYLIVEFRECSNWAVESKEGVVFLSSWMSVGAGLLGRDLFFLSCFVTADLIHDMQLASAFLRF